MKAVLFDFGGTLDSNGISCREVFYLLYKKCGLNIEQKTFDRAFYDADDNLPLKHNLKNLDFEQTFELQITDVLSNLKINNETLTNKILNEYLSQTKKYIEQSKIVLAQIKQKYKIGVISNFFGNLDSVLNSLGLLDIVDATTDSQLLGITKPDPAIFVNILDRLKTEPHNAMMVGDSVERDIKGASALNMKTALLWGDRFKTNSPPDLTETIILKNLAELPEKLEDIDFQND